LVPATVKLSGPVVVMVPADWLPSPQVMVALPVNCVVSWPLKLATVPENRDPSVALRPSSLRVYFQTSTAIRKLCLLIFPWRRP
jgi:hypothetical protein